MFKNFLSFKKSLQSLAAEVHEHRGAIEALQRERETVLAAVPTRDEVKAMLAGWWARRNAEYVKRLQHHMTQQLLQKPEKLRDPGAVDQWMTLFGKTRMQGALAMQPGPELEDMAICSLLGSELMLKSLDAAVDAMEWPANCMSLEKRTKRVAEIDAELGQLTNEQAELVAAGRQAGIDFERLPAAADGFVAPVPAKKGGGA